MEKKLHLRNLEPSETCIFKVEMHLETVRKLTRSQVGAPGLFLLIPIENAGRGRVAEATLEVVRSGK